MAAPAKSHKNKEKMAVKNTETVEKTPVNPLKNVRVQVKLLPHKSGLFDDTNHVLYGGMAQNSVTKLVCPMTPNGQYVKVLTDEEQEFIERRLGLEEGAMNPTRSDDNYWDRDEASVLLNKFNNFLDLSIPGDYIKYKILLACKDYICPSLAEFARMPMESYRFVIVQENEEVDRRKDEMDDKRKSYKEFWKVDEDADTLRAIIEFVENRQIAPTTKLTVLQTRCDQLIQNNAKVFYSVISDPLLPTKVLLRKATELGIVAKRNNYYYLRDGDLPLCGQGEESTLPIAARWLNQPKNQDILFNLQEQVKAKK